MKKWMNYVVIIGLTAGTASAAWWPFGDDQKEDQAPPPVPEMQKMKRDGMGERQRPQMSPEQMEKMKAHREELMKLGEAARNEADPVKKEALVADIRTKVTEMVDKMQAEHEKRLERAEKELSTLREKLAEGEKNKAAQIEEHVQRIVAGKPPRGDGKRPEGDFKREHRQDVPPPEAE